MKTTAKIEKRSARKRVRGFSSLSVIFALLTLSIVGVTMARTTSTTSFGSVLGLQGQQAFYVADGGMRYVYEKEIMNSTDFTTLNTVTNKTLGPGTFSVTYANQTLSSVDVTVVGTVANSTRQIEVAIAGSTVSNDSMRAGGNVQLVSSDSGGGTVNGDVYCVSECEIDTPEWTITGSVNEGSTAPSSPNLSTFRDLTTLYIDGDLEIQNGDYTGDVWVTGTVKFEGSGTVTGIIYAEGSILLKGEQTDVRNVNGTLAALGNIEFDFRDSTVLNLTVQGGLPVVVSDGNAIFKLFNSSLTTINGSTSTSGGSFQVLLENNAVMNVIGNLSEQGDIKVESKNTSEFNIDPPTGGGGAWNGFTITSWKET